MLPPTRRRTASAIAMKEIAASPTSDGKEGGNGTGAPVSSPRLATLNAGFDAGSRIKNGGAPQSSSRLPFRAHNSSRARQQRRRRLMFGILVSVTVSLLVPQSVVLRPCLRQLAMEPIRVDASYLAFPGSAAESIVTTNALAYQLEGVESGGFDTLLASAAPFAFGLLALVIFYQGWQIFSKTF